MERSLAALRGRREDYRLLLAQLDEIRVKLETIFDTAATEVISTDSLEPPIACDKVRKIIRLRARRQCIFGSAVFGEPAWDMLLDLYSSTLERRAESVTSLGLASRLPQTTALRWINLLEEQGWIVRKPDPRDGRRVLVSLSSKARSAMELFINQPELESL